MCGLHSKFNERDWYSNLWLRVTAHTRVVTLTLSGRVYTPVYKPSGRTKVLLNEATRARAASYATVRWQALPAEPKSSCARRVLIAHGLDHDLNVDLDARVNHGR